MRAPRLSPFTGFQITSVRGVDAVGRVSYGNVVVLVLLDADCGLSKRTTLPLPETSDTSDPFE